MMDISFAPLDVLEHLIFCYLQEDPVSLIVSSNVCSVFRKVAATRLKFLRQQWKDLREDYYASQLRIRSALYKTASITLCTWFETHLQFPAFTRADAEELSAVAIREFHRIVTDSPNGSLVEGNLEFLNHVYNSGLSRRTFSSSKLIEAAALGGHTQIILWLQEIGCDIKSTDAAASAAAGGHLEVDLIAISFSLTHGFSF